MTATTVPHVRETQEVPALLSVAEAEALTVEQVHDLYGRHVNRSQVKLMTSFGFGRELVESAEGCYVRVQGGRRILDFTGGVGVLSHGHNHPRILAARRAFADRKRMEVHKTYFSPYLAAVGHNLAQILPGDLNRSFLPNSGAEAVEGAVKLAYRYHGGKRSKVLTADIAFHGKLLGSGGLTGRGQRAFPFPTIDGIERFAYDDLASVEAQFARLRKPGGGCDVYALLVEPFSASTMTRASEEFLRGVRALCDRYGVVLIFDEIYTGWGKTGSMFHFMRYDGLVPDIVTTSKSFGGGKSSISAFVAREPIYAAAYDNMSDALAQSASTTYYGFGEEAATAVEAMRIAVDEDFPGRARALEDVLRPGLAALAEEFGGLVSDVRGCGALWGVFLDGGPKIIDAMAAVAPPGPARDPLLRVKVLTSAVIEHLYREHGIYTYYTLNGRSPLVLAPPLVATPAQCEQVLQALRATLSVRPTRLIAEFARGKVGGWR